MFWKASSTFDASKAEVSINDNPFSANDQCRQTDIFTSKCLCFLGRDSSEMSQIGFVSNQHNDDVGIGMITQLFEPTNDILICDMFGDIINK